MAAKKEDLTMMELLDKLEALEAKLEATEKQAAHMHDMQESALTGGQKQAILERNLQKAMKEAKKDTVKIRLPLLSDESDDVATCGVNGILWQVKRGEEVEVPRCVAEVFQNAEKQKLEARERRQELMKKSKKGE